MKSYLVKEINLTKYIFLLFISFIAISILSIIIIFVEIKIDVNLLIIVNALIFTFIILPRIKKVSSNDLTIKINNQSIYIDKFEINITKIDFIKIAYKLTIFPKLIIGLKNNNKHSFRILKLDADYHSLEYDLNNIKISK